MAYLLYVLSWVATLVHVALGTLALAAALYYLAELVEEYTSYAARVLKYLIFSTVCLYLLLFMFEDIPTSMTLCGLLSQIIHLSLLQTFPFFYWTSLPFISGVVLFLVNHYLAFSYFAYTYYPLSQVLAYFTLYIWIVPFGFFISLSANENILPTMQDQVPLLSSGDDFVTGYFNKKGKRNGLLSILSYVKDEFFPSKGKKY